MRGKIDVVDILLKGLTRVDIWTEGDVTLLHIAAERGWVKIIDLLLHRLSENDLLEKTDPDGRTALLTAASMGYPEACDLLIKNGADVNSKDRAGQTALHIAASDNLDTVAAALVNSGSAIIHASDANGRTPLSIAEAGDSNEVIKILMDAGAETHETTPFDVRRPFAPESARDQYAAAFYLKSASPEPLPMKVISYILDLAEYWVESRVHRAKTLVMDRAEVPYLCSPAISGFAREPVRKFVFSVTTHLRANDSPGTGFVAAWLTASSYLDGAMRKPGPNIVRWDYTSKRPKRHRVVWQRGLGDYASKRPKRPSILWPGAPLEVIGRPKGSYLVPDEKEPDVEFWVRDLRPGERVVVRGAHVFKWLSVLRAEIMIYPVVSVLLPLFLAQATNMTNVTPYHLALHSNTIYFRLTRHIQTAITRHPQITSTYHSHI